MLRDQHCQWAGRLQPARVGLRGAPYEAQGQRREDAPSRTASSCAAFHHQIVIHQLGLDPGPEPGRHHHRVEQGQDQGPAQPRTPGPAGVKPRGCPPPPDDIRHADVRICRTAAGAGGFVTFESMTNGDQHNRNRFLNLAMIAVFDIAGPLVAYSLLRSAGQSAVTALVLSGAFPALGVAAGLIPSPARGRHRRPGPGRHRGRHRPSGS